MNEIKVEIPRDLFGKMCDFAWVDWQEVALEAFYREAGFQAGSERVLVDNCVSEGAED